jgi:predicted dehydrogenase
VEKHSRLLRIGVLGAGPIAQFAHFEACRRACNAELYAVCDVAGNLLAHAAAMHHPQRTYSDFPAMLADPGVEAVIIATADAFHVPLAMQAIAAGKHVFVEKPLGVLVEECDQLEQAVRRSGLKLQVGFNRRFDPALTFTRRFVEIEIGRISVFNAWYCDSTSRYTMTDNLQPAPVRAEAPRRPAEDPKADKRRYFLFTHGSHLFDTARYLAGPIGSLRARWQESGGAHMWSVEVDFVSGCLGHLTLIIPARSDFEEGVQLFGDGGSAQGRLHLPWYCKAGNIECFSLRDGAYHRPLGADADTYRLQIESFASVILDGAPQTGASVQDGVENVRALVAVARSVEAGRCVRLDEVTGGA